jgi:hypothetical protein
MFATQDFSQFANLTKLKIAGLHGNLNKARNDLVGVLLKSPDLKSLGLSIDRDTINRLSNGGSIEYREHQCFLIRLCEDFDRAGGEPLNLEVLLLGHGVVPWKSGDYLKRLTDLIYLKEVYVTNKYRNVDLQIKDEEVAWLMFAEDHCPNLGTLGVFDFSPEARTHFTQDIRQFNTCQ